MIRNNIKQKDLILNNYLLIYDTSFQKLKLKLMNFEQISRDLYRKKTLIYMYI